MQSQVTFNYTDQRHPRTVGPRKSHGKATVRPVIFQVAELCLRNKFGSTHSGNTCASNRTPTSKGEKGKPKRKMHSTRVADALYHRLQSQIQTIYTEANHGKCMMQATLNNGAENRQDTTYITPQPVDPPRLTGLVGLSRPVRSPLHLITGPAAFCSFIWRDVVRLYPCILPCSSMGVREASTRHLLYTVHFPGAFPEIKVWIYINTPPLPCPSFVLRAVHKGERSRPAFPGCSTSVRSFYAICFETS